MSKIESSINSIRSDINTVWIDLKNDINNLRKDLNITKDKTETELSRINWILKEVDRQHFWWEIWKSERKNNLPHKRSSFLKTSNFTDRF